MQTRLWCVPCSVHAERVHYRIQSLRCKRVGHMEDAEGDTILLYDAGRVAESQNCWVYSEKPDGQGRRSCFLPHLRRREISGFMWRIWKKSSRRNAWSSPLVNDVLIGLFWEHFESQRNRFWTYLQFFLRNSVVQILKREDGCWKGRIRTGSEVGWRAGFLGVVEPRP